MLNKDVKQNIIKYIENLISELRLRVINKAKTGIDSEQIVKNTVKLTVNKLTPESKIILNRVYDAMKSETLKKSIYDNIQHKRAFYDKDILGSLNRKFRFEIPQDIDYKSCSEKINNLQKAGAICIAGGVVSFVISSSIPVFLAIVIAGLMVFTSRNKVDSNIDIINVIDNYLTSVERALVSWVESIEKFFDQQVQELEKSF